MRPPSVVTPIYAPSTLLLLGQVYAARRSSYSAFINLTIVINVIVQGSIQFLQQLAALFESQKEKGTIWLTHKRRTS